MGDTRNYNTRLPADVAEAFETYLEQKEISASEGGRRLISYGLIRQGYLPDDRKAMTDGGQNLGRDLLLNLSTLTVGLALALAAGSLFDLLPYWQGIVMAVVALVAGSVLLLAAASEAGPRQLNTALARANARITRESL